MGVAYSAESRVVAGFNGADLEHLPWDFQRRFLATQLIVAYPEEFEQLILGAADEGALEAEAEDGSFDE